MGFTPQYKALFGKAMALQAIALLQRDFAAAIAGFTPPEGRAYGDFNDFKLSLDNVPLNPPEVVVAVVTDDFARSGDLGTRPQALRLVIRPYLTDGDPQALSVMAYDFVAAIDQVVTSAPLADWQNPLPIALAFLSPGSVTTGLVPSAGAVLDVWVEQHDMGVLWTAGTGIGVRPKISVVIQTEET